MTGTYRNRWLATAFLWAVVVALSWWNLQTIAVVSDARVAWQVFSSSQAFIEGRSEEVASVNQRVEQLYLPVESPAFGLLAFKEELSRMASEFGLSELRIDSTAGPAARETLPLSVSFNGPLSGATQMLSTLRRTHPHLVLNEMRMAGADEGLPSFTLQLDLRYRIVTP